MQYYIICDHRMRTEALIVFHRVVTCMLGIVTFANIVIYNWPLAVSPAFK